MEAKKKDELFGEKLPGRIITKVVGKDSPVASEKMTIGFGKYCDEAGPMQPHNHAEETVYIVDARNGWVRYGGEPDCLLHKMELEKGMMLHFDELEWHVFEYGEGGFVEIIFIYGQTENIRPEEIEQNKRIK